MAYYTGTSTSTASNWVTATNNVTSSTYSDSTVAMYNDAMRSHVRRYYSSVDEACIAHGMVVSDRFVGEIALPDGGVIRFDRGKYEIIDSDSKITYRANRSREFNRYVNASDLIEEFVRYLGGLGLSQREVLSIPMELFILWLVVRAAEADGEDTPEEAQRLEMTIKLAARPRCRHCGRFVTRRRQKLGVLFCSDAHLEAHDAGSP